MGQATSTKTETHEAYIHEVRRLAIERALELAKITPEQASELADVKLVYGLGLGGGYRGVTVYKAWSNGHGPTDAIEIAAFAEESWLQLAGTTIHELGHVLAGKGAGHRADWKAASALLGLRCAKAAGMRYTLAAIDPVLREAIYRLAQRMADGSPDFGAAFLAAGLTMRAPRPCSAGVGSRGGKSRGAGSGSRLLKVECETCGYVARVTRKWLDEAGAPMCGVEGHGRMTEK